jgi:polysaccharide deacetylase 2 family uncharacterized protein YibQ
VVGGSQGELFGPGANTKRPKKKGKRKPASASGSNSPQGKPGKSGDENKTPPDQESAGQSGLSAKKAITRPPAGGAGQTIADTHSKKDHLKDGGEQGSAMGTGPRKAKKQSRSRKVRPRRAATRSVASARSKPKPGLQFLLNKRWGLLFYGATGLVLLVLLFLWLRVPDSSYQPSTAFMNGKIPKDGSITYEEPLPGEKSKAPPDIEAVDEALFTALRQAGIPPQATHLALAHSPSGEVSLVKAQLPQEVSADQAAAKLESNLAGTKAKGSWRANGHGRELIVSLGGRVTHKVLLEYPKPLKPSSPPPQAAPPPPAPTPLARGPRLAIIIDDMGYQWGLAKELINLGLPLTLSILPHAPFGAKIATLARKRGLEVMIHLPMEPRAYPKLKPGPGALLTSMTPAQLKKTTLANLASVPGAKGANNHMGSRFTEDEKSLKPVLNILAGKGLFFIDSMTSANSRAYYLARKMGMNAGRRTIFLDHDHSLPAIRRQLQRLLSLAKRGSQVVAIGHPHPATIRALAEFVPRLKKEVRLVKASQFLAGTALAGRRNRSINKAGGKLDRSTAKP